MKQILYLDSSLQGKRAEEEAVAKVIKWSGDDVIFIYQSEYRVTNCLAYTTAGSFRNIPRSTLRSTFMRVDTIGI